MFRAASSIFNELTNMPPKERGDTIYHRMKTEILTQQEAATGLCKHVPVWTRSAPPSLAPWWLRSLFCFVLQTEGLAALDDFLPIISKVIQAGEKKMEDRNDPNKKENSVESQVYKNNQKITSRKKNVQLGYFLRPYIKP